MPPKGAKHSAEARQKISEARKKYFAEDPKAREKLRQARLREVYGRLEALPPTHKRCSKCRKVKRAEDFYERSVTLSNGDVIKHLESSCKGCCRQRNKDWVAAAIDRGIDVNALQRERYHKRTTEAKARTRELAREAAAIRRRQQGSKARGSYKLNGNTREMYSVEPIAQFLERELENYEQSVVSAATKIPPRRLYSILHREEPRVSLKVIDAILTGLGVPEEMHFLYPEED